MNQWINHSHPMTLRGAVILGYITSFFSLLFGGIAPIGGFLVALLTAIGVGLGAFASANNKKWGYLLLGVCATITAIQHLLFFLGQRWSPVGMLFAFNNSIFAFALIAAVLHVQSREYQKIWFE